jgi:hypothetical protein
MALLINPKKAGARGHRLRRKVSRPLTIIMINIAFVESILRA